MVSHCFLEDQLSQWLQEDLGRAGDLTTQSLGIGDKSCRARVVARQKGCIAGLEASLQAFTYLDAKAQSRRLVSEGALADAGDVLAEVESNAGTLLAAERTALNLLGLLSGVATATREAVLATEGTGASIVCTRKTVPGLRVLQKYAVRMGGGKNHRYGLDDAVLIKDNHIALVGSVSDAVVRAKAGVGHLVKVEVEVDTLDQLKAALEAGADAVLLDNMSDAMLCEAVGINRGRAVLEASGGIQLERVRSVAQTGVNLISLGWLTHSSPSLDVALDFL